MNNKHLFDNDLELKKTYPMLSGTDEAGRGPIAGPVVCASVILPDSFYHEDLNDSKQISEKKRKEIFEIIKEKAVTYSIVVIDHYEIDQINILNATLKGMKESIEKLDIKPALALIDGNKAPKNFDTPHKCIKQGDANHACIAAASILAKVTRDNIMYKYDKEYPQYGFAKHKGYPVAAHIDAVKQFGICQIHRKTYKPICEILERYKTIEKS